jgi:small subunit ribosomal protein S17
MSASRGQRRTATGTVEKGPKDKTIAVRSIWRVRHPRYRKYVRRVSRYMVHDEREEARPGDIVEIMETRPLSKTKSWRLVRIVSRRAEKGSEAAA